MKWIVLVIVVFVVGYTFLTLRYRKPGKSYEPYHDMTTRANTGRLLAAGYQRVELVAVLPTDPSGLSNNTMPAPGGLPDELKSTLVVLPTLPIDITDANAKTAVNHDEPYEILFRCTTPNDRLQFVGAELYVKGDELTVTPRVEKLGSGLQARTTDSRVRLTIPAGTLKPGEHRITVLGERLSRAWTVQVR